MTRTFIAWLLLAVASFGADGTLHDGDWSSVAGGIHYRPVQWSSVAGGMFYATSAATSAPPSVGLSHGVYLSAAQLQFMAGAVPAANVGVASNFSIIAWVSRQTTEANQWSPVFHNAPNDAGTFYMGVGFGPVNQGGVYNRLNLGFHDSSGYRYFVCSNSFASTTASVSQVAVVYRGSLSDISFYIDATNSGYWLNEQSGTPADCAANTFIKVGARNFIGGDEVRYDGNIYRVLMYPYALSESQIATNYASRCDSVPTGAVLNIAGPATNAAGTIYPAGTAFTDYTGNAFAVSNGCVEMGDAP